MIAVGGERSRQQASCSVFTCAFLCTTPNPTCVWSATFLSGERHVGTNGGVRCLSPWPRTAEPRHAREELSLNCPCESSAPRHPASGGDWCKLFSFDEGANRGCHTQSSRVGRVLHDRGAPNLQALVGRLVSVFIKSETMVPLRLRHHKAQYCSCWKAFRSKFAVSAIIFAFGFFTASSRFIINIVKHVILTIIITCVAHHASG